MATVRAAPKILMVDDAAGNLQVLRTTLEGCGYRLLAARNGAGALSVAAKAQPDLILLDIVMPDMDGYDVCRRLKAAEATRHIPVIFLTALDDAADEAKGLALGAVDYIPKPIHPELVRARVHTHLELKRHQDHLKGMVKEKTREVRLTQAVMIESLGTLAEYRDPETGGHIKRTQNYVKALAMHLRGHPRFRGLLNEETIELLYRSAPLHDVGKVGVRDHILLKAGRLDEAEFEQMKLHTLFGEEALHRTEQKLGHSTFLRLAREIAGTHQEKWNGSGYPRGLKGDAIPFSGRLMAVADVYDALISKRIYKPPLPHEKAVAIIRAGQGVHFDPDLVDAFLELETGCRPPPCTAARLHRQTGAARGRQRDQPRNHEKPADHHGVRGRHGRQRPSGTLEIPNRRLRADTDRSRNAGVERPGAAAGHSTPGEERQPPHAGSGHHGGRLRTDGVRRGRRGLRRAHAETA